MSGQYQSREPERFQFMTETGVVLWTGYAAAALPSLLQGLRQVPGSSIYYHVHHAMFRRPKYTWAEYTNDLARWVFTALGQKALAERLSSVDPLECASIRHCREELIALVQEYVADEEDFPRIPPGRELYLMKVKSFAMPTGVEADDIHELADGIERGGSGSVLYHFIEARFRNGKGTNDFSRWLMSHGEEDKAAELAKLNPYHYDLDELKGQIVEVLRS